VLADIISASLENHGNKRYIDARKITGSPHCASAHCKCTVQRTIEEDFQACLFRQHGGINGTRHSVQFG
jgi:hypothetical protein